MSPGKRILFVLIISLPTLCCVGGISYARRPDAGVQFLHGQAVYQQRFPGAEQRGTDYRRRGGGLFCQGGSSAELRFWTDAPQSDVMAWYEQALRGDGWDVTVSATQGLTGTKPGILTNTTLTARAFLGKTKYDPYAQPVYYVTLTESVYCAHGIIGL